MRNQTHLNYEGWLEKSFSSFSAKCFAILLEDRLGFFIQKNPLSGILTKSSNSIQKADSLHRNFVEVRTQSSFKRQC